MPKPLFSTGQLVATPGALDTFNEEFQLACLQRHLTGDWGDLDAEDRAENDRALKEGDRLLSSYKLGDMKLWIITEWDRSVTTLLLPEEY
jgi:hypothetical protein